MRWLFALLLTSSISNAAGPWPATLAAQTPAGRTETRLSSRAGHVASFLPSDVSFVVRIEAEVLASSPVLARLLDRPEASNPLARALARPTTLARMRTIYIGFPAGFTPASTELPVLLVGSFREDEILAELDSARGVEGKREGGRVLLVADDANGTSYATPLGEGALALGDRASVLRMVEVMEGKRTGVPAALLGELGPEGGSRHIVGVGRVPVALRGYLQAEGGSLAASLATIDRLSFEGSLGQAVNLSLTLQPSTPAGKAAIEQALGALRMFGPSRFAADPEVLSAIQSLRFSAGPDRIDVSLTLPRSLLLRKL